MDDIETVTVDGIVYSAADEDGNTFDVVSPSGGRYRISYAGSGDADPEYVALWNCDCPAGQHGRTCKHLTKFIDHDVLGQLGF